MPNLSVIVPVLNERDNVEIVYERLVEALPGIDWEVIYVDDDSADGTALRVRELANRTPRVRLIHRIGRKGLSSACVEGMQASTAPYVAVMDGDLQHDERILPKMLSTLAEGNLDIVVASRNIAGGSMGEFAASRVRLSNLGKTLSRSLMNCPLSDPMSGFFMLSRSFLDRTVHNLSQLGFKILLDLFSSSAEPVRYAEVPYTFRTRQHGESKLDFTVNLDFLLQIIDRRIGNWIPVRFVLYAGVGASGVLVGLLAVLLCQSVLRLGLIESQIIATAAAIVSNFFLNNAVTYRDCRLRTARGLIRGFAIYACGCTVGAIINLGITRLLLDNQFPPYLASGLGLVFSSVWNFSIATALAWQVQQRRRRFHRQNR